MALSLEQAPRPGRSDLTIGMQRNAEGDDATRDPADEHRNVGLCLDGEQRLVARALRLLPQIGKQLCTYYPN